MLMGCKKLLVKAFVLLPCCVVLTVGSAHAGYEWLTMSGDGERPYKTAQDLIQVSPETIQGTAEIRTMQIRVNRSAQRNNWDGLPYRSYVGTVEFDCAKKTARYVVMNYYMTPIWEGPVYQTVTYPVSQPRLMAFRDVVPNPKDRIVKAACTSQSVLSN